jgi:single-stranded-DNA-specific exonuclease
VVVSIASDIVPITGENRVLAFYGLKRINANPRVGFEAILNVSSMQRNGIEAENIKITRELTINDLVFIIGPRINAAGRIESARNSVALLVTENREQAYRLGRQINDLNTERKNLDTLTTSQAVEYLIEHPDQMDRRSTVLYNPKWHKGVIGIVASRLIEIYYKPTIVLTYADNLVTGSARSIKGFDIYDAVDACGDLLEHFGGHTYAAGLSMKPENFGKFSARFEEYVQEHLPTDLLIPEIEIDSMLQLKDINTKFYKILKQFAPFGPGNMSPVFQTNKLIDTGYARIVGNNHLKLSVVQLDVTGFPISSIAFQQGEQIDYIKSLLPFNICYHLEENEWNNQKSLQLNIKDIKPYVSGN